MLSVCLYKGTQLSSIGCIDRNRRCTGKPGKAMARDDVYSATRTRTSKHRKCDLDDCLDAGYCLPSSLNPGLFVLTPVSTNSKILLARIFSKGLVSHRNKEIVLQVYFINLR